MGRGCGWEGVCGKGGFVREYILERRGKDYRNNVDLSDKGS